MPRGAVVLAAVTQPVAQHPTAVSPKPTDQRPQLIYAELGEPVHHAFTVI
jgi:hypothetical protein